MHLRVHTEGSLPEKCVPLQSAILLAGEDSASGALTALEVQQNVKLADGATVNAAWIGKVVGFRVTCMQGIAAMNPISEFRGNLRWRCIQVAHPTMSCPLDTFRHDETGSRICFLSVGAHFLYAQHRMTLNRHH